MQTGILLGMLLKTINTIHTSQEKNAKLMLCYKNGILVVL
jgi:hypothetical protein